MKTANPRILVAGATGYLGSHIVKALLKKETDFKALARNKTKLTEMGLLDEQIELAQVTDADTLYGCCDGIDVVISCVGITRQKDGLGYMDVDYQANLNLLQEAERAGVKKFIYISAFNAPKYQSVRLLQAKERFAVKLLASTRLAPCVVRPNGFYSDIEAFYAMARAGRVYLFGKGDVRFNPIHGDDLAQFCLDVIESETREFDVGGPEVFSANEIAELAFNAQEKTVRITYSPDWMRKLALRFVTMLPEKLGGPVEFFLTAMAQDMVAPTYGHHTLSAHFQAISQAENK
ncbi:MAG: hypothetical protein ACI86X_002296 [Moritella sp.]|jgi:uncharacterized protein YbjT (DUF2867 family)